MKGTMKTRYIVAEIRGESLNEVHRADTEGECIAYIDKTPADLMGDCEYTILKVYTNKR